MRYLLSYWVVRWVSRFLGWEYPVGTIFVNVTGSFLLGIFVLWSAQKAYLSENVRLLVATGFFGAYITFSTFANESASMFLKNDWPGSLANIIVTNVLCLRAALLGLMLASRWWPVA